MDLNERKIRILEAIINDYISTAEPIGSRTIAKKYNLGISSATIRNEMSDLEDMGLIIQPHASAGRVPSDKGYRLYVDRLMHHRELSPEEVMFLRQMITSNINQIDYLMQETAKAISLMTKYTTIVTEPQVKKVNAKHKHIQLVPIDERSVLLVMVSSDKTIKNHIININNAPDYEVLNNISVTINQMIQIRADEMILDEIVLGNIVFELASSIGGYNDLIDSVLRVMLNDIQADEDINIYTSGVRNILDFPEFSDIQKAKGIFKTLEEKEMLVTIMGRDSSENIQVIIGSENDMEQLKNCSVIKAKYSLGGQTYGSIGVIGPTRMDYSQAISVLNAILSNINNVIKALSGG